MASASPNYVLFLGTSRYLYRPSNDASLSPTAALTLSVTLDPEGAGTVTNGTVVSKMRSDNSQYGWKIEYIASTQKVKCTIYGNAAGTIFVSRETNAQILHRRNVTFTYAAGGTLNAYVDGVLDNGTAASAGTFVAINASTEPMAICCDSRTGAAANVWKGLVYMFALWNAELTAGNLTAQAADGLITATMLGLGSLQAYWRHSDIACNANNDFLAWVDNKSSLALTSAGTPKAQQTSGTAILTLNLWDANLNELALGTQGLSSTYTLSAPYRLWGAALNEPQIASGYRSYRGDFTAVIRARRVAGRTTSKIFRRHGIYFEYILSSQELYCIVGDDNVGSNNKRISWGFKLFPVKGVDAVYVLRYNAVEKDIDLFLNQIKYTQVTNVATTSNEMTTGMFVGESTDWQSCAITPMCLTDAQVDTFVLGLAQNTYPIDLDAVGNSYANWTNVPSDGDVPAAIPATATDTAHVPEDESDFKSSTLGSINYTGSPTVPYATAGGVGKYETEVDDYIFTDPLPAIVSADYVAGVVTVVGNAGPIEGEAVRAWIELEISAGEFQGVGDVQFPVALKTRQPVNFTFATMPGFNAGGYSVRIAIQPQENSRRVFYSAPVALDSVAPTDPMPTMVSAVIGSDATCTATANAGPTNAGSMTVWFEEETSVGSNNYQRVSGFDTAQGFGSNRDHVMAFSLGSRTGHTGRKMRFAMQQESNPVNVYHSDTFVLTDYTYISPAPSVQSWSININRTINATGNAGPTDVGPCSTWWELEVTAGEFIAVLDKRTGVDLSSNSNISDSFTIPPNFSLAGKQLRFAVQPAADPGTVFYATAVSITNPTVTDPGPVVTAAACSLTKLLTASANVGVSNAGPATIWWEVEHDPGEWTSILDSTNSISLASGQTRNLSYQLPQRLSLTGKSIRLAVRSTVIPEQTWYSPSFTITQTEALTPSLSITSAAQDTLGSFTAVGSIGATNLGNFNVHWEANVQGDFLAICEPLGSLATSPSVPTAINANVSVPVGLDLVGKEVRIIARSLTFPELSYTSAPFIVTSADSVLPNPAMVTAVESATNILTLQGTAGPSIITSARVWFEVNDIGSGDFDARFGEQTIDVSSFTTINASVTLPNRLNLSGRSVILRVSPASRPDIVYSSAPLSVTVQGFVDPLPAVSAANQSLAGVFTGTAQAGASDIGTANVWWESTIDGTEFSAIMEKATVANLSAGCQTINANVTLPTRFDLTGKSVRLAVQQASRPDTIYYSATFPVTVVAVAPPTINVSAANVSIGDQFSATVVLGANNLGNVKTWWEVEITTGEFIALFDPVNSYALNPLGATVVSASPLPSRFDLNGKNIRFAIQWLARPENTYYSALFPITVENLTDPAPLIQSFEADSVRRCFGSVRAGPTNGAFCKVWWEVGIENDFVGLFDTVTNVNLFSQQIIPGDFRLPRADYTGKFVRFAVQTNIRPELIYYSPPVAINIVAHELGGPVITDLQVTAGHNVSVTSAVGPLPHGPGKLWYEIEISDTQSIFTEAVENVDPTTLVDVDFMFLIDPGMKLRNKRMRAVFAPYVDELELWYSDWEPLVSPFWDYNDCTPQRICEVWSGALQPSDPIPDLSVDVYDAETFALPLKSTLEPVGLNAVVQKTLDVNTSEPQLLIADAPAGMYRMKYVSGAIRYTDLGRKNYYFPAYYRSCDTYGLWVIGEQNPNTPSYVFGPPAFIMDGYPGNTTAAETAAAGYEFIFYHTGGDLSVAFDIPAPVDPNTGSIVVEVADLTDLQLCVREWTIVEATNPATALSSTFAAQPTMFGLEPGFVRLRRVVTAMDNKSRWQDVYVRVWSSKMPADERERIANLFPAQPTKPAPDNKIGWGGTVRDRRTFYNDPPNSGNR